MLSPVEFKDRIVALLDGDKAEDIVVIDLQGKSSLGDYMVIASGTSGRQLGAMGTHLVELMHSLGRRKPRIEGATEANWVVVDTGDVIVHLFRPEVRAFYNLEKMWQTDFSET